jgi:hypothetical protein
MLIFYVSCDSKNFRESCDSKMKANNMLEILRFFYSSRPRLMFGLFRRPCGPDCKGGVEG